MKLEKDFLIKNIEGDFAYSIVEISGETRFNDDEKSKLIETNFKNVKAKLIIEIKELILDEAERRYLSGVIRPFKDEVTDIIKYKSYDFENKEYIVIHCNQSETTMFPYFDKGTMYKGMELDKEYTLEELGL